jgi:hypothetical protein
MATIDGVLFMGEASMPRDELAELEIPNTDEAVTNGLKQLGWDGKSPAGCVVLQLAADNSAVTSGQFVARGQLAAEELRMDASRIWNGADANLQLSIQVPRGEAFKFSDGGLCSDFMAESEIEYCITTVGRSAQVVLQADYKAKKIGNFCIRMVCDIKKATARAGVTLNYKVMLYPGTEEEVTGVSELARSPSWPGLKLTEGELALLPRTKTTWKCPIRPLIRTGTPWEEDDTAPPMDELRAKIAWVMATSEPADACKTRKALVARWRRYANNPDEFSPKKSALAWPRPQHASQTGGSRKSNNGTVVNIVRYRGHNYGTYKNAVVS